MFKTTISMFTVAWVLVAMPVRAIEPVVGKDYQEVKSPEPTAAGAKIVVVEFFSFYCHHCANQAARMQSWRAGLGSDIATVRVVVPILDQRGKEPGNQAFLALGRLAKGPALENIIFNAIHQDKRGFADVAALRDWLVTQGVAAAAFDTEFNSFGVNAGLQANNRRLRLLMESDNTNIPVLAIDGRYLVSLGQSDIDSKLKVADALIARARAGRATAKVATSKMQNNYFWAKIAR